MTKLILHPLKSIPTERSATGFAEEMHALAELIGYAEIAKHPGYAYSELIAGGYYSELWLSCFGEAQNAEQIAGLVRLADAMQFAVSRGTRIVLICNDPAFFCLPEAYFPRAYWRCKMEIAFCGTMPWPEFVIKHMKPAKDGYWRPISNRWFNLPLWQNMFGCNSKQMLDWPNAKARPYDLLYVGYDRGNRKQQLEPYMASNVLCTATANIALSNAIRHTNLPKQPKLSELTKQAKATIAIGDAEYVGLLPFPKRVLESIAHGLLTFISPKLDPLRSIFPHCDLLYAEDALHIKQVLALPADALQELWLYQLQYLHDAYDNAIRLQRRNW